jgi:hypothetical protein
MAYKVRLGNTEMSGTLGTDDIHYTDDTDTLIDFGTDKIKFKTNNTNRVDISNDRVQIQKQLVIGTTVASDWSLVPPSEDGLHVQDGTTIFQKNSADAFPPIVAFNKSRSATDGSNIIVQDNDCTGYIHFMGNDGSGYEESACIAAYIDGTPGSDDMPGRLEFSTTPDGDNEVVERMRIDSTGKVGIGTTSPDYTLDVAGDIGVDQYIYHNGDADTWMKFGDNAITFKAGNLSFINLDKKGSAPHEFTINDGSNNIDLVVKGNGSNEGNPLFKCDASTGRVGINGVGSPDCELHVDGDIKLVGNDPRIKIDGDVDSHPGLEFYENGTRKWIIYNNYGDDSLDFKTDSAIRMVIDQTGEVGIGTTSPKSTLSVAGSLALNVTGINSSNDPGTTYSMAATDCVLLINTRATHEGGINSVITLPAAASFPGRVVTIKDAAGNADQNAITISRAGNDTINGIDLTVTLSSPSSYKTLISDGVNSWQEIGS